MRIIWTRTVHVKKTGKTYVYAFSDFRSRAANTLMPIMDNCAIGRKEMEHPDHEEEEHRFVAEQLRDAGGYQMSLTGGKVVWPSGHRKFIMSG